VLLLPEEGRCCTCCCCRRGQGSSQPLVLLAQTVWERSSTKRKGATGAAGGRICGGAGACVCVLDVEAASLATDTTCERRGAEGAWGWWCSRGFKCAEAVLCWKGTERDGWACVSGPRSRVVVVVQKGRKTRRHLITGLREHFLASSLGNLPPPIQHKTKKTNVNFLHFFLYFPILYKGGSKSPRNDAYSAVDKPTCSR